MEGAEASYWSPQRATAAQRALALTPGGPSLAEHWPLQDQSQHRAGNVTTLMARQDIYRLGMWTHSHPEVIFFNTAKHLQRTSYTSTWHGKLQRGSVQWVLLWEDGTRGSNSCSSILPAPGMLHTAIATSWSQTRMQLVHRKTSPLVKLKAIKSWIKHFVLRYKSFWL